MIAVFIAGNPAPQGSKRYVGNGIMVESCKRVKPWRADIRSALLDDEGKPKAFFTEGVHIDVQFVMPRPKSCPKKRTPLALKKPDIDKLERALLDACSSAGIWPDDSHVVSVCKVKRLARLGETPGCHLEIMNAIDAERKEA